MLPPGLNLRTGSRFVVVGVANTAFGLLTFVCLELWLGGDVPYLAILLIAHGINVTEAFLAQRLLVFRARGYWWSDYLRFWAVQISNLLLNAALLPLLVEIAGMPVVFSQALIVVLLAILSFHVHQRFTFRGVRDAGGQDRVTA
jgi:putative flippase GtrA